MNGSGSSLRQVLGLRLAGAGLMSLLSLLAALAVVYSVQQQRLQSLWLGEARTHFERQIQRVEVDWARQADLLRAQVEFTGVLDEAGDGGAALRFTAFFASLGGESLFTHVLVRSGDGREVASYATRSGSTQAPPVSGREAWSYAPADALLYRVIRVPVRLGRSRHGEMLLFVPLNNSLIDAIAFPEAQISLHWRDQEDLAVSSHYQEPLTTPVDPGLRPLEAHFRWSTAADAPLLHVRRSAPPTVLPLSDLMALAVVAATAGMLLAWLVIGRWAGRHVGRINALAAAVDQFAARQQPAQALAAPLEGIDSDSGSELRRLASGLASMMRTTESAETDTAAARDHLATLNATLEARVAERTRELELARDEALAAVRARQRIMAGVSHELRTPLMGLLGNLELIDSQDLAPDQRRLVDTARQSGWALRAVVDDVLDYSRLEAVGASLHPSAFRPAELAGEVVSLYEGAAQHRGLRLQCECDGAAQLPAMGDAARLRQVLLNLVGNALKFTDHGSVVLRVAAASGPGRRLRFEVTDSGIGMDAALIDRLFDPFVQAEPDGASLRGGTGLGLSIAQRLVVAMGGQIAAISAPHQGSTFWFELPLPEAATDPPPASLGPVDGAAPPAAVAPRLQGRVLLVDDNAVNRMIGGEMLRRLGLQVEEAENGLLALEALRRAPADLVLMDRQMPVLDGVAAAQRIRRGEAGARAAQLPIVAVTADALEGDADLCRAAGMNDHLAKPFTQDELLRVVQRWLAQRATPDRGRPAAGASQG